MPTMLKGNTKGNKKHMVCRAHGAATISYYQFGFEKIK